jgi:hypothetical protein
VADVGAAVGALFAAGWVLAEGELAGAVAGGVALLQALATTSSTVRRPSLDRNARRWTTRAPIVLLHISDLPFSVGEGDLEVLGLT